MNDKALVIQPGKLGDILITAPIVKYYYDLGYTDIHWPVFSNFTSMVDRFEYVKPISFDIGLDPATYLNNKRVSFFDKFNTAGSRSQQFFKILHEIYPDVSEFKVIDACFAFPGHFNPRNNEIGHAYMQQDKSWLQLKYDLVEVPLKQRWSLDYTRDIDKEDKLLDFIKKYAYRKYGSYDYSIVQEYEPHPDRPFPKHKVKNPINFSYVKGYEIVDWLKVLENALEIVCIDSCLCHFVEVASSLKDIKKVYLGTEEPHHTSFMNNILFNNWTNLSETDISYGVSSIEDL